jgi:hypothetical protein
MLLRPPRREEAEAVLELIVARDVADIGDRICTQTTTAAAVGTLLRQTTGCAGGESRCARSSTRRTSRSSSMFVSVAGTNVPATGSTSLRGSLDFRAEGAGELSRSSA